MTTAVLAVPCPRCGVGMDTNGGGDCAFCHKMHGVGPHLKLDNGDMALCDGPGKCRLCIQSESRKAQ